MGAESEPGLQPGGPAWIFRWKAACQTAVNRYIPPPCQARRSNRRRDLSRFGKVVRIFGFAGVSERNWRARQLRPDKVPRRRKADDRGEVAEWLKAHAWNACIRATVSRVRIPLSPPALFFHPIS